ncbi:thiosulfate oxidation carrier complex protein SoxZ [Marinobacterium aestuariivivens]|uniref:Thiosulfate oxidation carrier complex protein SoxZ n=1 Tax=Marinobacterium aestuariivivens TaxID=1698799 RepID=A0ABW2A2J6_9GAMM
MKVDTRVLGDIVTVQLFLEHPMVPGTLCNRDAAQAHFIRQLEVRYDGERIFSADLSEAVSEDPFLRFRFQGRRGGRLDIRWRDNRGQAQRKGVDI